MTEMTRVEPRAGGIRALKAGFGKCHHFSCDCCQPAVQQLIEHGEICECQRAEAPLIGEQRKSPGLQQRFEHIAAALFFTIEDVAMAGESKGTGGGWRHESVEGETR